MREGAALPTCPDSTGVSCLTALGNLACGRRGGPVLLGMGSEGGPKSAEGAGQGQRWQRGPQRRARP